MLLLGALAMAATGCRADLGPEPETAIEEVPVYLISPEVLENLPGPGLGEAILIDFGPDDTVSTVFVLLRVGILSPGIAARSRLEMTITSVDGIDHFHGTALIPVTDIVEVAHEGRLVTGEVTWTVDEEPQVVGDVYTVCSTLQIDLGRDTWSGPERCQTFGPFF